ncbi:ATP-binding protein [Myxococcota bacterium]|nr:ATP-binding protein [Myxococcota bacterium]
MTRAPPAPRDLHLLETGRLAELGMQSAELVHELRQPVFASVGLAQLARAELDRPAVDLERLRGQLDGLVQQLDLMHALLGRYGGAGRRPSTVGGPVLLAPPVTAAVQMLDPRARSAGLSLVLELVDGQSQVLGEVVAIQQVAANLLQNALDAARSRVRVRVEGAVLRVLDDGPDPGPDVLGRLFEPFFTTKPPGKGTGLGLAVTRHLVEAHGGSLRLERLGDSTVATVQFQAVSPRKGP